MQDLYARNTLVDRFAPPLLAQMTTDLNALAFDLGGGFLLFRFKLPEELSRIG